MNDNKIICMIPARMGSERLRFKNLALLKGKPLISHVIDTAKKCNIFEEIYINSENELFEDIATQYGISFHLRPANLGTSEARSDDVCAEMMKSHNGDILVWLNPISPLQPVKEVKEVIKFFIDNELDTLITVKNEQVHAVAREKYPINFSYNEKFAKTQDLTPIKTFVYSIMMWRYKSFLTHYKENGYALLSGKVGYFPVCKESSIIIKREEDLCLAELMLKAKESNNYEVKYDDLISDKVLSQKRKGLANET